MLSLFTPECISYIDVNPLTHMFWALIIALIIPMQPCKLVQAISLRFERNKAKPRRHWCIRSRVLTENGNRAPCADGP